MPLVYSKKDNATYATIYGLEKDEDFGFEAQEIRYKIQDDGHILLYGLFDNIIEVKNFNNPNFVFTPQLCQITIHTDNYNKPLWNKELKKFDGEKLIEIGTNEKFLSSFIQNKLNATKSYVGVFNSRPITIYSEKMIFEKIGKNGETLENGICDFLLEQIASFVEYEPTGNLPEPVIASKASNNTQQQQRRSITDNLRERQSFVATSLNMHPEATIPEIMERINDLGEELPQEANKLLTILKLIMG